MTFGTAPQQTNWSGSYIYTLEAPVDSMSSGPECVWSSSSRRSGRRFWNTSPSLRQLHRNEDVLRGAPSLEMPDKMPEDMPDRMPEGIPDRMPEGIPDRMPEDMPDRMPEGMPDRMPDKMSNRMPQDMPDRIPEDLPIICQKVCQIECQIECQKICQKICQYENV